MLLVWRGLREKRWDKSRMSELFSRDENSRPEYIYDNFLLKDRLKIWGPNLFRRRCLRRHRRRRRRCYCCFYFSSSSKCRRR